MMGKGKGSLLAGLLALSALHAACSSSEPATSGGGASGGSGGACPAGQELCGESCVRTDIDPLHCGLCDNGCKEGQVCQAGECAFGCSGGTTKCGGGCVDLELDKQHCGACDQACPEGQVCSGGACGLECSGGAAKCGEACVDLDLDPSHCGACETPCAEGEVCSEGQCGLACLGGTTKCGDKCVGTDNDPAHCGGCDQACAEGDVCSQGACALSCAGGTTKCGTSCVNITVDPSHCGQCDKPCAEGEVCSLGQCGLSCTGGTKKCGSACVDTGVDPKNCGACGAACAADDVCTGGVCALKCSGGTVDCAGKCVDTKADAQNCGGCAKKCAPGEVCSQGSCATSCGGGSTLCGSSCVDLQTSSAHCGACGAACAMGKICVSGACTTSCSPGFTNCSEVCVDLQTDASHCGSCSTACSQGQVCGAGSCVDGCTDGVQNGAETAIDCGGASCPACADGLGCAVATDCQSGSCFAGKCGPRMWTVESNGSNLAVPPNNTWVPAANLSLKVKLYATSLVSIRWTGTLRYGGGGNGLCHVGQRFVVDGTPTGHATWGDAIMVLEGSTRWHELFTTEIAMMLPAGDHTIAAEMTNANGYATCYLDGDGGLAYDRSRLAVAAYDPSSAWYAASTGPTAALGSNSPWVDIPGAALTIPLATAQHVQLSLQGSQLVSGGGQGHCAYRLVVDGAPLGEPSHGQAIAVGDADQGWWAPVAVKHGADLALGNHAVTAQVRNSSSSGASCIAAEGNNPYSRFHLLATASAKGGPNQSVESSGGAQILGTPSPWTPVGGLSASFVLPQKRHVQLEAAGTQRTTSGSGHCAYRFVLDGQPLGDANHGQAINVGEAGETWWTATGLLWGQDLAAGNHTVGVEFRNSGSGICGVNGDAQPYGRLRLLVRSL